MRWIGNLPQDVMSKTFKEVLVRLPWSKRAIYTSQRTFQEECPYSQQEPRTILSQEGEYDVYINQAHFTHSTSTPLKKDTIMPHVHLSQISLPFCEFHGKRHYIGFYVKIKKPSINQGLFNGATTSKEINEVLDYANEP